MIIGIFNVENKLLLSLRSIISNEIKPIINNKKQLYLVLNATEWSTTLKIDNNDL